MNLNNKETKNNLIVYAGLMSLAEALQLARRAVLSVAAVYKREYDINPSEIPRAIIETYTTEMTSKDVVK